MPQNDYCISCKHYVGLNICKAFLEGIPEKYLLYKEEHNTIEEGQDFPVTYEPL